MLVKEATGSPAWPDKLGRRRSGPRLNIKTVLSTYGDFHIKIRRPLGRLIFNMGIAIPGKTVFLIETAPRLAYIFTGLAGSASLDMYKTEQI